MGWGQRPLRLKPLHPRGSGPFACSSTLKRQAPTRRGLVQGHTVGGWLRQASPACSPCPENPHLGHRSQASAPPALPFPQPKANRTIDPEEAETWVQPRRSYSGGPATSPACMPEQPHSGKGLGQSPEGLLSRVMEDQVPSTPVLLFPFFPSFFYFNWQIITLQHCDGFCHTST